MKVKRKELRKALFGLEKALLDYLESEGQVTEDICGYRFELCDYAPGDSALIIHSFMRGEDEQ